MAAFFNKRIETPFEETYKGYNQYLFTGGVDDLFLMDSSEFGDRPKLCRIAEAIAEYGKKKKYDLVITIDKDLKLLFANKEQEDLFQELARGSSSHLVENKKKSTTFVPRPRANQDAPASPATSDTQNVGQNNMANAAQAAAQQAREQAAQSDGLNRLSQITRVLKKQDKKTLVIFPYPEKMIAGSDANGSTLQRFEVLVKDWRDIIQEAHPETRTVLIVNPYRLQEFHLAEHTLSCYDHNCREITLQAPPIEEMKAWLKKYRMENSVIGTRRDSERVVLTGKANAGGNLQNFVSWVQGFFQSNPNDRQWNALLTRENQEAAESKECLLDRLDEMIGLDEVKTEIHKIVEDVERNNETASNATYHMFFLGNPGTGKTEVANIIAKLFWAMELRTSKTVVSVAIQDIVSQYNEGDTIQKMKDKVAEAMGGVLFIDEAYLFAESDWGRKAFQVLLTEMENNRKNLTVILAGYEERLQALKDVNPGIDSRIPYKLHFKDYNKEQKLEIFKLHLKKQYENKEIKPVLSKDAEAKLLRILDGCEGNGRGVRSILENTLKNANGAELITDSHVKDPHEIHMDEADKVMEDIDKEFIGMETLKERLREYFLNVQWDVERNKALGITKPTVNPYRIRFVGPPGTGKTSIARYMGRFFHAMGICETDECHECGATSLKGAYLGHAQQAVNNLFHDNRGKVIFIDEIYSLYNPDAHQDDSFSREVIDTLVRCLTAEEYQRTVVIVAGYKDKVDRFMEANPGLSSRIPDEIVFDNYSADACVKIFEDCAKKNQYVLEDGCQEKLKEFFEKIRDCENFGNARTVKETFGRVVRNVINRLKEVEGKTVDQFTHITEADVSALLDVPSQQN